jgi:alpha-L-arabinofuranosidase
MSKFGRGRVLRARVECDGYATRYYDPRGTNDQFFDIPQAPYLKLATVANDDGGLTIFALNRDLAGTMSVEVSARGFVPLQPGVTQQLHHADLGAVNTKERPDNVSPIALAGVAVTGDQIRMTLAPASWNVIKLVPA